MELLDNACTQTHKAYYSYNPSCISTFRPIVNYDEVDSLQEVQMNISSNEWTYSSLKFKV